MKHIAKITVLVLICALLLTGCGCKHVWYAATCEAPQTCSECGETEGEALGHSWVDATCAEAKHCTTCGKTEGEALGHQWQEATTEAPKTCSVCGETEGERIITDPRFVTASVAPLLGEWSGVLTITGDDMDIPGLTATLDMNCSITFHNDGNYNIDMEMGNVDAFKEDLINYTIDLTYQQLAAEGLSKEQADQALASASGMDVPTYVREEMGALDIAGLFTAALDTDMLKGVYYMENDVLYTGINWDTMGEEPYTLEGDTLMLLVVNDSIGKDIAFTRVK